MLVLGAEEARNAGGNVGGEDEEVTAEGVLQREIREEVAQV